MNAKKTPPQAPPLANTLARAGLDLELRQDDHGNTEFEVAGNTHTHRALLRDSGGNWDSFKQVWTFSDGNAIDRVAQTLRNAPPEIGNNSKSSPKIDPKSGKPHYHGHRQRLRERFMGASPETLPDYELLELLLFFSIPRVDVKPLAKELLEHFGSLGAVLAADPDRLAEFNKVSFQTAVQIRAMREMSLRLIREEISEEVVLTSWKKLISYCKAAMAHEKDEQFRVLFLNTKNTLIADEVQQRGTVDHTPVYPRQVVKRALELSATAIIMVHNHPSGDATPSKPDIAMTKQVRSACESLNITLHDHLIIAKKGYSSFKEMGLL